MVGTRRYLEVLENTIQALISPSLSLASSGETYEWGEGFTSSPCSRLRALFSILLQWMGLCFGPSLPITVHHDWLTLESTRCMRFSHAGKASTMFSSSQAKILRRIAQCRNLDLVLSTECHFQGHPPPLRWHSSQQHTLLSALWCSLSTHQPSRMISHWELYTLRGSIVGFPFLGMFALRCPTFPRKPYDNL